MIALAAVLAAAVAFSPFTREEEHVREGNERLLAGDAEGALRRYEAAERAVGERAEIDFDRAHAAIRLGRIEEAQASLRRAAERGDPALASRALQNLGHTLAGAGEREAAVTAYSEALRTDPENDDARHDLEVLLRQAAEERPPPPPGGGEREAPAPAPERGKEERDDPGQGRRAAPERPSPGEDPGPPHPPARPGPEPEPVPAPGAGARGEEPAPERTRQEAEQLLDALRARERKLPLSGRERTGTRRTDAAKDW